MQLTASESNQLDWYIDDENRPVEAIKLIDEYLSSLTASDSDELISIYFKFEKEIKSQRQRQRIEKHKANMYNLLVKNGVLGKKQDETEVKIYKLELYKRLTEDVGLINVKIEVLKEVFNEVKVVAGEHFRVVVLVFDQVFHFFFQVVEEHGVAVDVLEEELVGGLPVLAELDLPIGVVQVEQSVQRVVVELFFFAGRFSHGLTVGCGHKYTFTDVVGLG